MGIGITELVLILVIVLIIFGAGKLPEIGNALGKGIQNFRKAAQDTEKNAADSSEDKRQNNHLS